MGFESGGGSDWGRWWVQIEHGVRDGGGCQVEDGVRDGGVVQVEDGAPFRLTIGV